MYEHREEPNGVQLVLSIDQASVTSLDRMEWRPFSGVGQASFSLLGTKPEGKKYNNQRYQRGRKRQT
jgi:hypothetical protein